MNRKILGIVIFLLSFFVLVSHEVCNAMGQNNIHFDPLAIEHRIEQELAVINRMQQIQRQIRMRNQQLGAIDAAELPVQDREVMDWVGEHPVAATCIVIGGVTVIGLTVDAIVNGKKSVIGRLFYEDESEEKLQEESLGIEEDEDEMVDQIYIKD